MIEQGLASEQNSVARRSVVFGGAAALILAACGSDAASEPTDTTAGDTATSDDSTVTTQSQPAASDPTDLTLADFSVVTTTCALVRRADEGPFPTNDKLMRRDVTEGYPGHALRLGLHIVDENCDSIPGAVAEIWHCDTTGDYSAFIDDGGGKDEGEGTTFLRGSQVCNDDGIAEFLSVVPGWYPGRAVHIHVKVFLDDRELLTSQLYFDGGYLAGVYDEEPYAEFGLPDTSNESDGIAGDVANDGSLVVMAAAETANGTGSLGLAVLGVTR